MENIKFESYFIENNLRGFSHRKIKTVRFRNKVVRAINQLKKKDWFVPMANLLLIVTIITIGLILIDLFSNVT